MRHRTFNQKLSKTLIFLWQYTFTARLEVGAARRQAIIQQQSQTIKELEVC